MTTHKNSLIVTDSPLLVKRPCITNLPTPAFSQWQTQTSLASTGLQVNPTRPSSNLHFVGTPDRHFSSYENSPFMGRQNLDPNFQPLPKQRKRSHSLGDPS